MVRLNDPDSRHTIQLGLGCTQTVQTVAQIPALRWMGTITPTYFLRVIRYVSPVLNPNFPRHLRSWCNNGPSPANGNGDILCPATNRTINGLPVDDSRRFAPILVGDSITAEGNYEKIGGSTLSIGAFLDSIGRTCYQSTDPRQPDYIFLDEVGIDAPGFQNRRARSFIIGYATLAPADVMIWSIHYDSKTNSPHEFLLWRPRQVAMLPACGNVYSPRSCRCGAAGGNIFKIGHDVDFAVPTKPRWNPCFTFTE